MPTLFSSSRISGSISDAKIVGRAGRKTTMEVFEPWKQDTRQSTGMLIYPHFIKYLEGKSLAAQGNDLIASHQSISKTYTQAPYKYPEVSSSLRMGVQHESESSEDKISGPVTNLQPCD